MLNRFKPGEFISPLLLTLLIIWVSIFLISKETAVVLSKELSSFLIPLIMLLLGIGIGSVWRGAYEDWLKFVDSFNLAEIHTTNHPSTFFHQRYKYLLLWLFINFTKATCQIFFVILTGYSLLFFFKFFQNFSHPYIGKWWLLLGILPIQMLIGWIWFIVYEIVSTNKGNSLFAKANRQLKNATDFTEAIAARNEYLNNKNKTSL